VEVRGGHVMTARSLLIRGPHHAEPPEAHLKIVPVGKRTAFEVPEKVVPWRTGIRRTRRSPLLGHALAPDGEGHIHDGGGEARALLSRCRLGGSDPRGVGRG